jgi:sec-independent protein translocase protein TatC
MNNSSHADSALQGFLEHLIELRDRLFKMVIAVTVVFIALSPFVQDLYNALSAPLVSQLPNGSKLIAIGVATPFLIPFKLALLVAFLIALPYVFYQIWGFVAPGLYQHEKRLVTPLLVSSVALFYIGMAFAYFVVIPMIARASVAFAPSNVTPTPDIAEYLDFTIAMFLAFGLSFETPIATILLITMGVVSADTLTKARPYIIVGAFVIGMFLTPPDVVSQTLMAVPIWLLFEAGLFLSKLFQRNVQSFRDEKQAHEQRQLLEEHTTTPPNTATTAPAPTAPVIWEDEHYSFKETQPTPSTNTPDYRPLNEAEMEAEMQKIDTELQDLAQPKPEPPKDKD